MIDLGSLAGLHAHGHSLAPRIAHAGMAGGRYRSLKWSQPAKVRAACRCGCVYRSRHVGRAGGWNCAKAGTPARGRGSFEASRQLLNSLSVSACWSNIR
jgi:hypothetical protein